tara:strand:+ start:552 stop:920 length:369 start_codon:yes stop_codon:yes gene_type:complete
MFGYAPKLPVLRDSKDGFVLIKSMPEAVKQNLKNLVLTSPGERVMDPAFGVGIRDFLFQQNTPMLEGQIENRILSQVNKYMPFVGIIKIQFGDAIEEPEKLYIQIEYSVEGQAVLDILRLVV